MQLSRNPFDGKNNRQYRIGNVRWLGSEGRKVYVYMYFCYCMIEHKAQDPERKQGKKTSEDDLLKEKSEGQTTKHVW